jgi:tetratricopeptide (TPR) repeat protein
MCAVTEATESGHAHMLRYYKDADESHINKAATQFYRVLDHCPIDHPARSAALSNLAMAKFISSQATGVHLDLDMAIFLFQDACDLRPRDHPDHPSTLLKLAITLLCRFSRRCDAVDADKAKELLDRILVSCSPISLEYRSAVLVTQTRSMHCGAHDVVSADATVTISSAQLPNWSPYSIDQLRLKLEQCKQRDNPQLLDEVISQHRDALSFYVPGQPQWIQWKCNLAVALYWRFGRQGQKQDLGEVICAYRDVLVWTARRRTEHSMPLNNIVNVLLARFQQSGDRKDLEEAIQHNRDALVLRPPGHPDRGVSLNNLANMLWTRFQQGGDREDLEEAIQYYQHALVLTPPGHRNHGVLLNNFANMLWTRFQQGGDRKDLEEAIQHYQDVLVLVPLGHPHRASPLNNIANALLIRFEQGGDGKDLEEAIQHYQGALVLRPHGHPRRGMSLNGIANALWTQFKQGGVRKDLEEATQYYRDALILTPPGHPLRASSLNNIANVLWTRFQQGGDRQDLEEAIQYYRNTLILTPPGHPHCGMSLNNIASVLVTRFQQDGDRKDLEEAIQHHQDALALRPPGHPDRGMSLNNIAIVLRARFHQGGDRNDLEKAIQHNREALVLTPPGHPHRGMSLYNLATVLVMQFEEGGDRKDLEEAIQHHQDALILRPPGHPDRGMLLNNIATALLTQFEQGGDRKDLEQALQLCHIAKAESPPSHPIQVHLLGNFALIHLSLYHTQHEQNHLHSAMSYFSAATTLSSSNRLPCLNNCMSWIQHAEHHQHSSALDAYTRSLELLDSYLSATASVSARHQARLNFSANLSVDAASCALRCGDICQALELLEQGRTILWNQMAQFRTQLERLDVEDPHAEFLIQRFQHLSFMLNQQPANRLSTQNCSKLSAEAEAQLHRDLIQEWNMVVTQIRTLKGFSRFLLPPLFSDLQEASCDGPVIVLIASTFSCDAVIVLRKQPPVHICLKTTLDTLTPLTNQFRKEIFNLKEEYPRFTGNYQQKESLQTEFIRQHSEILMELEALYLPSEREIPNGMIKVLRSL